MLVLLATIAAFLVDVFAGAALLLGGRLYLGAVLVFFLARARRAESALAAAVGYGLLSDVLNVAVPFGTLVLAHALFWLALYAARGSFARARAKRTAVSLCVTLAAYGFTLELALRFAAFLFADIAIAPIGDAVQPVLSAAAVTLIGAAGLIMVFRAVRAHVKKWFFIK